MRQWCVLGQGQGGVVTDDVDPVSRADSGLVKPVGAGACGTQPAAHGAGRLRRTLAGLSLPRDESGRLTVAVDVSPWLRPDAATSADRMFCHVYGAARATRR